ncbi:hypothetical protein PM082_007351 [Marasmius tenuissimus]|nr:hypothetical protein PM082_007351 [Marasmius tenuissimus]
MDSGLSIFHLDFRRIRRTETEQWDGDCLMPTTTRTLKPWARKTLADSLLEGNRVGLWFPSNIDSEFARRLDRGSISFGRSSKGYMNPVA